MTRVAREAPDALSRAVRYSALVLKSHSPRRTELDQAASESEAVAELCHVLDLFALAHRERIAALEAQKARLEALSVFDVLLYASLYAFEVLVPRDFEIKAPAPPSRVDLQLAWDALSDLLAWKLASASISSLKLTDESVGRSVARHLRSIESGTADRSESVLFALFISSCEFTSGRRIVLLRRSFDLSGGVIDSRLSRSIRWRWQRDGLKLEPCMYWFHVPSHLRRAGRFRSGQVGDRATAASWPGCGRCRRSFNCVRRTVLPTQ